MVKNTIHKVFLKICPHKGLLMSGAKPCFGLGLSSGFPSVSGGAVSLYLSDDKATLLGTAGSYQCA